MTKEVARVLPAGRGRRVPRSDFVRRQDDGAGVLEMHMDGAMREQGANG